MPTAAAPRRNRGSSVPGGRSQTQKPDGVCEASGMGKSLGRRREHWGVAASGDRTSCPGVDRGSGCTAL